MEAETVKNAPTVFQRLTTEGIEKNLVFLKSLVDSELGTVSFYQYISARKELSCDIIRFIELARVGTLESSAVQVNFRPVPIKFTLAVIHDGIEKEAEFFAHINTRTLDMVNASFTEAFGRKLWS